jgi:ribosome maturation factor RimP
MFPSLSHALFLVNLLWVTRSFTPTATSTINRIKLHSTRPRSRVTDPSGPTPVIEDDEIDLIDQNEIPEMSYEADKHPIPHQPWRRGETAGCEDPIDAEWRQKAEDVIRKAVEMIGGDLIDTTWHLTSLVVTVDENVEGVRKDLMKTSGPVINFIEPESPTYRDPSDPNPEDIWADDDNVVYEKDEDTDDDIRSKMYSRQEEGEEDLELDEERDVPLYSSQETREDDALRVAEEAELLEERQERPINVETLKMNTPALSLIAGAIIDALETVEEDLKVLERHEIVMTSPGAPDVLETQSQFDAHRGYDVAVETQDPWDSNRTLRGKLLDRNSMDVMINQKGRMVTIPLNFVKCVRLPHAKGNQNMDVESFEDDN